MLAFFSRIFLLVLAIILIVVGLILLPLPIPFGLITIILGVSILISSNDTAAEWVRNLRRRNPRLNGRLNALGRRLPARLSRIIHRTTP